MTHESSENIFSGTGKTRVVVAAVHEIVRTTDKNVLICAQSNAAVDEITLRLLKYLEKEDIFRIFAKSMEKAVVDPLIVPISNAKNFEVPDLAFLYQFRVIVCTLSTATIFSRARHDRDFDSTHFSYTFIDEAACVSQSMTLMPIAGVSTDCKMMHSKIILAGDPNQLEPVVKSTYAIELGFQRSLMEYLFNQKCYRKNPLKRDFNPKHIVQLKQNYRSHPSILHIANRLFYDNMLQAAASSS